MSTFNGYIEEFPDIRIDAFRTLPGKPAPLACFLSHVHSDHLAGLEYVHSPFIYCSAATREILLRLESYPHRVNLQKRILERRIQNYKHLHKLLKPLPLETPTRLELSPGNRIQVTLFNANHCIGAVMFLVQSQAKAILYTGDIRCESWWLDSLTRNPVLLPYAHGLRKLDKIYLDTTFAAKHKHYRQFPSKSEGIRELLEKLSDYPVETVFYFRAWTYGYEDVWLAMSDYLDCRVHLDDYRYRVYTSIAKTKDMALAGPEVPSLAGFLCGNTRQSGILTRDAKARIHSCEKGSRCSALIDNANVVEIIPIVSRYAGTEMRECGAGGGRGDLDQTPELSLNDPDIFTHLKTLFSNVQAGDIDLALNPAELSSRPEFLHTLLSNDTIKLDEIAALYRNLINQPEDTVITKPTTTTTTTDGDVNQANDISTTITFPYSRHSSYHELRLLISAFKPKDIHPCTVAPVEEWNEELSMESLFGDLYDNSNTRFAYDEITRARSREYGAPGLLKRKRNERDTQETCEIESEIEDNYEETEEENRDRTPKQAGLASGDVDETTSDDSGQGEEESVAVKSLSAINEARLHARQEAFAAATAGTWSTIRLASLGAGFDDNDDDDEL